MHELIPNFTEIPNIFIDEWQRKLSCSAFSILILMSRKIYGLHKTTESISISQLCRVSGLSTTTVIKSLKELEKNGLIIRQSHFSNGKGQETNSYRLNEVITNG